MQKLNVGGMLGQSSSLSPYAGPYVTGMLGKGAALSELPYQAYMGTLTAGQSNLQDTAIQGLANLTVPTAAQTSYDPQSFTGAGYAAPTAAQAMIKTWGTRSRTFCGIIKYRNDFIASLLRVSEAFEYQHHCRIPRNSFFFFELMQCCIVHGFTA